MTGAHLNQKGGNKEPPLPSSEGRTGEAPSEATDSGKTRQSSPRFTAGETAQDGEDSPTMKDPKMSWEDPLS